MASKIVPEFHVSLYVVNMKKRTKTFNEIEKELFEPKTHGFESARELRVVYVIDSDRDSADAVAAKLLPTSEWVQKKTEQTEKSALLRERSYENEYMYIGVRVQLVAKVDVKCATMCIPRVGIERPRSSCSKSIIHCVVSFAVNDNPFLLIMAAGDLTPNATGDYQNLEGSLAMQAFDGGTDLPADYKLFKEQVEKNKTSPSIKGKIDEYQKKYHRLLFGRLEKPSALTTKKSEGAYRYYEREETGIFFREGNDGYFMLRGRTVNKTSYVKIGDVNYTIKHSHFLFAFGGSGYTNDFVGRSTENAVGHVGGEYQSLPFDQSKRSDIYTNPHSSVSNYDESNDMDIYTGDGKCKLSSNASHCHRMSSAMQSVEWSE